MADTTALKNRIRAAIKSNDNQEITGPVLQQALLDMVDELNGATETEASQRQSGDSTLQQGINTERQARIDADAALSQRITEERQRAEAAFDKLDIMDDAGSQVSPEAINLTLRKNDGSDEEPEWRTLSQLLIPSATNQRAGLMSAAMYNLLYNLRNAGYAFGGIAVPNTNPNPVTANCFYIVRGAGTYTHFKNSDNESIVIENDGLYVFTYEAIENNYWEYNSIIYIDDKITFGSNNLPKSGNIYVKTVELDSKNYRAVLNDINLNSSGNWVLNTSAHPILALIDIKGTSEIKVQKGATTAMVSLLKSLGDFRDGGAAEYCEGESRRDIPSSATITVPNDCQYLVVWLEYAGNDYTPSILSIDGVDFTENITNLKLYVDNKLLLAINNINKLEGDIEGITISQPSLETIDNRYITSGGQFVNNSNYSTIVDIHDLRGYHLTQTVIPGAEQYAFLKSYNQTSVEFVDGGGRINGNLDNTLVPSDANYVYIYLGGSPTLVTLFSTDAPTKGIKEEIIEINEKLQPIAQAVEKLNWPAPSYIFDESQQSKVALIDNIVLSENGDSIEFKVDSCEIISSESSSESLKLYAFTKNPNNSSKIAIGVSKYYLSIRADDSSWIFEGVHLESSINGKTVKIAYESGNVNLYIDNQLTSTHTGQKTMTISGFGDGSTYGYWTGSFSGLKVNNEYFDLSSKGTLSNVSIEQDTSFLSENEKEKLNSTYLPAMMVEKIANKITIYKNISGSNYYIGYPLNHRNRPYVEGQYPSFMDNWGIGVLFVARYENNNMLHVANLFRDGEAEVAINVPRGDETTGNVFVGGGAHGFETIRTENGDREFMLLINNIQYSEDSLIALKEIDTLQIIQGSNLYQSYSNTNPFAYVTKNWYFNKNSDLEITSRVKILRNIFIQACELGMFCVYRRLDGDSSKVYVTNRAIKDNNPYHVYVVEDGWDNSTTHPENNPLKVIDYNCNKITEYGECGIGFALASKNSNKKSSGGMNISTNSSSYNKIYFEHCNSYNASADEELYGTQVWEIRGKYNQQAC